MSKALIRRGAKPLRTQRQTIADRPRAWVLEVDGKRRLSLFSSQDKMQAFGAKISQDLNKVFRLGCILVLLEQITKQGDIDIVDLNAFSKKSWEICIGTSRDI